MPAITPEIARLLADPHTIKILATVDADGSPHAVVKDSLHVEGDTFVYLERLESSATNRNMVRSIWFDRRVAVTVASRDGVSFQIKGRPVRAHICGPVFRRHYEEARRVDGDGDLAAVWVIRPEEILEQTLARRQEEEEAAHPFFRHLDRLTVTEETQ